MEGRKLVVANWKSNGRKLLIDNLNRAVCTDCDSINDLVLCPPAALLAYAVSAFADYAARQPFIRIGAQDCAAYETNCTGDIPCSVLAEIGVSYVIIGHSERRRIYCESNELIAAKVRAALQQRQIPIVCVGESLQEREAGRAFEVIKDQLAPLAFAFQPSQTTPAALIAYEPVWAIGAQQTPQYEEISEIHSFIHELTWAKVLYGGGVTIYNCNDILRANNISGVLVGRSSLAPDFYKMLTGS
ncbi:MAG: triose-phosphate isomerase [Holosporales bacterium]|jgi:triosephosphate isomerase|nr:triose-phosphate isomerase [Holosporales bacterium]